jgi:transcriptional regulator with XRE-family HTH domain
MSNMSEQRTAVYSLGERIRKAREDMGWKQSDLADGVKKSRAAVAGWENNNHRPSALELDRISELTGYPIEFFIAESGGGTENYLFTDQVLVAA